jgi:membrane protease YdiL (CAAX protease family)
MGNNVISLFKQELKEISSFFQRYYREIVVTGLATLFLALNEYYPISHYWLSALVYFAILPVFTIIILLKRNPLDFGFRPGNYRVWLLYVAVSLLVWLPVLFISSRFSALEDYYTIPQFDLLRYSGEIIVYMFAWEFLFRGFLLFGLKDKLGEASILVQMMPFALLHFGKPGMETIGTILMGIYFGYIVYRGNSYWPALIIHLFANISFRVVVNLF